ncbi:ppGpp synthetase/RelA/SpoT-type nucleotidyltransferase [Ensifer adhaerens]|uniref:PpGpp synthetase/RelA/SpoT-type nucleotidyltransferase n=1 Tax=Ensifer adhaerens TaxID=106592 RepID=A0ACC5SSY1_ENSAD|nr:RelA/SpoT domain-containing protein [Ensifer adhaerens]MBP1871952.1 ppGpp synthetase/RelA/SpoT-type nucleotidyltransferase [Ensifer adhaerens]
MNIDEYERSHFARYQRFAETVRLILERAISATGDLPRPVSIQSRAKTAMSLRKRLEEAGIIDADVSAVRRDLAGVRLIFYTNNDVNRFLNSSIVFDNFDVDRAATKIHHPLPENDETRYRAVHYTVSLNEARSVLPEYQEFAGLRCEIQIQTILIHAWAETSHDIIYKVDDRQEFGTEALTQIKKRFDRIMDQYLVPAGYEFQRVQQDYERLVAGKELFDQKLLESLRNASNNNDRHQFVTSLGDDLLPLYDDVPSIFPEVLDVLVEAAITARVTPVQPIETPFSSYKGYEASDVTEKAVEIIDRFRYTAIEECFQALQKIFADESNERIRTKISETVGRLAQYNLQIWHQVGSEVQRRLASVMKMQAVVPSTVRPLFIETWNQMLDAEATGNEWTADAVSIQFGEVPIDQVHELRQTAISALFEFFEQAGSDQERRKIFHALENAKRPANRGDSNPDFQRQCLIDHKRIIDFLAARAPSLSYELRETIEHSLLYDYHHAIPLLGTTGAALGCQHQATELTLAIRTIRDAFNEDPTYFRYKILVGYEGVMAWQWDEPEFDPERVESYRDEQSTAMLGEVTDETQEDWLRFLERCAATKSNDLATFPKLGQFIVNLAKRNPSIAEFMLDNANDDLLRFLPGFLNGLFQGADHELYRRVLTTFLAKPGHLSAIALHWRGSSPDDPDTLAQLLHRSLEEDDRQAIAECAVFVIREFPDKVPPLDVVFRPALRHFINNADPSWIRNAWLPTKTPFFDQLDAVDADLILESLLELTELSYDAERLVSYVAVGYLERVWEFLGRRFAHPREESGDHRFEAVPYRFQLLTRRLSSNAELALNKTRSWFDADSSLFAFRGGKVLAQIFPACAADISDALIARVTAGDEDDARFVLGVMQNFHGEPSTHAVLKALLVSFPESDFVRSGVARSIQNTGVVHGEFGFVDSLREKKTLIEPWLNDDSVVADFARQQISSIEREILSEQRRAEERNALRRLEFGEDLS